MAISEKDLFNEDRQAASSSSEAGEEAAAVKPPAWAVRPILYGIAAAGRPHADSRAESMIPAEILGADTAKGSDPATREEREGLNSTGLEATNSMGLGSQVGGLSGGRRNPRLC